MRSVLAGARFLDVVRTFPGKRGAHAAVTPTYLHGLLRVWTPRTRN